MVPGGAAGVVGEAGAEIERAIEADLAGDLGHRKGGAEEELGGPLDPLLLDVALGGEAGFCFEEMGEPGGGQAGGAGERGDGVGGGQIGADGLHGAEDAGIGGAGPGQLSGEFGGEQEEILEGVHRLFPIPRSWPGGGPVDRSDFFESPPTGGSGGGMEHVESG